MENKKKGRIIGHETFLKKILTGSYNSIHITSCLINSPVTLVYRLQCCCHNLGNVQHFNGFFFFLGFDTVR